MSSLIIITLMYHRSYNPQISTTSLDQHKIINSPKVFAQILGTTVISLGK
jgi:hypothetical protein